MPSKTSFLDLVLPGLNEFRNAWHTPVNQNMETLDDYISDLYESLVGASDTATWSALRGNLDSLAERLDVALDADGNVDLSSSPDLLALAASSTKGTQASPDDDPRGRFDASDLELYDARQPHPNGRFTPAAPTVGYPEAGIDAGIAIRGADRGANSDQPLSSPMKHQAEGLVSGGDSPLLVDQGDYIISVEAGTPNSPAIFNIDGYIFRIREQLLLRYDGLSLTNGNYYWVYVDRDNANYSPAEITYYNELGTYTVRDLRKLREGANPANAGITSGSSFVVTSGLFTSTQFRPQEGDILVIESGAAAGSYAIDSIDGPNALTIRGIFKADAGGLDWHILDQNHPHVGVIEAGGDGGNSFDQPPYSAGRVFIGRFKYNSTGNHADDLITFPAAGVYDSGWQTAVAATIQATPMEFDHYLGVVPTQVTILVRSIEVGTYQNVAFQPIVVRTVQVEDTPSTVPLMLPALSWYSNEESLWVRLANASTVTDETAEALFTNPVGVDVTGASPGDEAEIRVIARR